MPDDEQKIYILPNNGTGWQTGNVITADRMNDIGNVLHYTSEEIVNATKSGHTIEDTPNNILQKKLENMVKYFNEPPQRDSDLQYTRLYAEASTGNNIIVPTQEQYLKFKNVFVSPFDKNKNYQIGDYIQYNDQVYKVVAAITANTSATEQVAWEAINDKINKINVMEEVANLITFYTEDSQLNQAINNRLYIKNQNQAEIQLPTLEEFNELSNRISTIAGENDIASLLISQEALQHELEQLKNIITTKAELQTIATLAVEIDKKADNKEIKHQLAAKATTNDIAAITINMDVIKTQSNKQANTISNIQGIIANIQSDISGKISKPQNGSNGIAGQVLTTNGSGNTFWGDPTTPTDEQIGDAVNDWLTQHPSATTTVIDGSITPQKLSQEVIDLIGESEDKDAQIFNNAIQTMMQLQLREEQDIQKTILTTEIYSAQLQAHASRYLNDGFGFLFFTDPHNLTGYYRATPKSLLADLKYIRRVYENTPAKYVFCGGDWLNTEPFTAAEAAKLVGRVQNLLQTEIGPTAYTVYGNHDNNQEAISSTKYILTQKQLAQMWYGKNVLYFKLDVNEELNIFMLDLDYSITSVSTYQLEELAWLSQQLLQNTKPHLFGIGHIAMSESSILGEMLFSMLNAFNQKTSIIINNNLYDFTNAFGTWHFVISGHVHADNNMIQSNIPIIRTVDFANTKAIDLCYVDWLNSKLYLDRIGNGNSRIINIIPTNDYKITE